MQGLINGMSSADIQGFVTTKIAGIAGSAGSVMGSQVATEALKFIGTPYLWGGTTPSGFDCSGLVQYVYKQLGVTIGRDTTAQVKEGTAVSKKNLEVGDIVFFGGTATSPDHEALYMGNGMVEEAPHTGTDVKEVPLSSFNDYDTARRILTDTATATGNTTQILTQALKLTGTSTSWLSALQTLVSKESGGNQSAVNSTAVLGQHATGILQMLPSTFEANMVKGYGTITNGLDNAMSAINYIKKEYGNPNNIKNLYNSSYEGYAVGTESAEVGVKNINEEGAEIVVGNKANFQGGEKVIKSEFTKNLMQWGAMSPYDVSSSVKAQFNNPNLKNGSINSSTSDDHSVHIENLSVVADSADDMFAQLKVRSNVAKV